MMPDILASTSTCLLAAALSLPASAQQSAVDLFEPSSLTLTLNTAVRLEVPADLDGDGSVDLVSAWVNSSNTHSIRVDFFYKSPHAPGSWSSFHRSDHESPGGGVAPWDGAFDVVAGDFNGDGVDEALIFNGEEIRVFKKEISGRPERILLHVLGPRISDTVAEALPVDFNNDGLDDLVLVNDEAVRLVQSRLDAAGNLRFSMTAELPSYGGATRMAAMDVFGTATPELVLLQDHGTPVLWTMGIEGGVFTESARALPRATVAGQRMDLAPGDLDGDGDLDAVLFGHDGVYQVVENDRGVLALGGAQSGGPATMLADLDGDGDLDGICCGGGSSSSGNDQPSTFHVSLNGGAQDFEPAVAFPGIGGHHVVVAHDFDDDGDLDVLAGRSVLINRTVTGANYCSQTANSTGAGGVLEARGSSSFSLGGPVMRAHSLPPHATSILLLSGGDFAGDHAITPFWDGQLCLDNVILRVGLTAANGTGSSDFGPLFSGLTPLTNDNPHLWLGRSWALQVWHRDIRPGGSGATVTDAVRLHLLD